MLIPFLPSRTLALVLPLAASLALGAGAARAEKADRNKPMAIEADSSKVDLNRNVTVLSDKVSISQGTMLIRADKAELRELSDGYRSAVAFGAAGRPASFRQKRDGVDEFVEGTAERIEYDSRSNTLRFIGKAVVKRLRGAAVADEINGALIVWDSTAETFSVQGGSATGANPGGRVRAVLAPRAEVPEPPAAGAPALKPARSLGEPR